MPTSGFMMDKASEFIFSLNTSFTDRALQVFDFQYMHNDVYKRFVDAINCKPASIKRIEDIPFLPISFFKTHRLASSSDEAQVLFESSGTTGVVTSKHFVTDITLYERSFVAAFEEAYGSINEFCVLGLLPSYLERKGSSLVYMVQKMMELSGHPQNGFHLYDHDQLAEKLLQLEKQKQKTLLIGVTYALLDFAEKHPIPLRNTIVMETGGMKGRKKELLRSEVHDILKQAFYLEHVHSEYGMTELLSQAYSTSDGTFKSPHWMQVLVREEDDPFRIVSTPEKSATGVINVIDLANVNSCSFIATEDLGRVYPDGSFEVLGRVDNSDIRGCSLLAL